MTDTIRDDGAWRLRPAVLAAFGAIAALVIQQLVNPEHTGTYPWPELPEWRIALAIGIGTGALAFGFGLERVRYSWTIVFALIVGVAAGLIHYWSGGGSNDRWFGDWRYASLYLAIAIIVPLFQTARDEGAGRFPYAEVHGHAWTNVVLWFACCIFTGIAWGLAYLLAALFDLIGLHFLTDLLKHNWFDALLWGAAFGGALGLLRERDRVVRLLQRVVTAVLAVLAPVLAVGLVVFLIALPFTGLSALWQATKSTTPILLTCVIGALVLSNAVVGNGADEELPNPVLRWSAMALGAVVLPLCLIAAVATGLRIGQYGITPDRLWALVFVILATAYGIAYLVALLRGRQGWAAHLRPANLKMAFIVAGVGLFLATPILSFNTVSTRAQLDRLESRKISAADFDWAALAFDFGEPGKAAVAHLAKSSDPAVRQKAAQALAAKSRYELPSDFDKKRQAEFRAAAAKRTLKVLPIDAPAPQSLRDAIFTAAEPYGQPLCHQASASCLLYWQPGQTIAVVVEDPCYGRTGEASIDKKTCESIDVNVLAWLDGKWIDPNTRLRRDVPMTPDKEKASLLAERAALNRGDVELRNVTRRQVFVGGKPQGAVFE